MKALINADELANDVAGAEALLDRHQEHKVKSSTTQRSKNQSFHVRILRTFNFTSRIQSNNNTKTRSKILSGCVAACSWRC